LIVVINVDLVGFVVLDGDAIGGGVVVVYVGKIAVWLVDC
jgi:hypothetical protein